MAALSKSPGRSKARTSSTETAFAAQKKPARAKAKVEPRATVAAVAFDLTGILAQSSWHAADEALAKALRDFSSLERVAQSLGRKLRGGENQVHAERMEGALLAVTQSLRSAGRRRNMQRFGEPGAVEDFDERLHELDKLMSKPPGKVRVLAQGVARGLGPEAEIILKARVTAVRLRVPGQRKAT